MSVNYIDLDLFLVDKTDKKYLFLFDWDDTLFPSSFMCKSGYWSPQEIPGSVLKKIKLIECSILELFNYIISFSAVIIVTNSDKQWMNTTCKLFMPQLYTFIKKHVFDISAKNIHNIKYPDEPIMWKAKTMKYILNGFCKENKNKPIVSIGDSVVERVAFKSISNILHLKNVVSIKFIDSPSINQLRSQLVQLKEDIEHIKERTTVFKSPYVSANKN